MYCFANQSMLPDLKAIWKESFGDEEAYIDFFFSNQMRAKHAFENQLIYMESNHISENLSLFIFFLSYTSFSYVFHYNESYHEHTSRS